MAYTANEIYKYNKYIYTYNIYIWYIYNIYIFLYVCVNIFLAVYVHLDRHVCTHGVSVLYIHTGMYV